ncbi:MAG: hypothetical protein GXO74_03050 [Calditrichaeota bacterium]|nr:hypothetical protein [Calditrichota bacterium]
MPAAISQNGDKVKRCGSFSTPQKISAAKRDDIFDLITTKEKRYLNNAKYLSINYEYNQLIIKMQQEYPAPDTNAHKAVQQINFVNMIQGAANSALAIDDDPHWQGRQIGCNPCTNRLPFERNPLVRSI